MTKVELRKIIKADLKPRYEMARDSRIEYTIAKRLEIKNSMDELKELRELDRNRFGISDEDKEAHEYHYAKLHGELTMVVETYGRRKGQEVEARTGGLIRQLTNKEHKLIRDKRLTEKGLTQYFTKEFAESLFNIVEGVTNEIKKLKPKNIIPTYAMEHDIHFILEFKDGKQQSFTINTIQAGGYDVQCLHLRTLKCLHKNVVL